MGDKRSARKTIITLAVLVYCGAIIAVAAYRVRHDQSSTSDFDDFWLTGRHFLNTGEMIEDYGVHNYLPFFLVFITPFSMLPLKVASIVFNLIALAGFWLSVRMIDHRLAQGQTRHAIPGSFVRVAAPILMCSVYITGTVVMGQMALFTLAMLVLTWDCVEKKRDVVAGFWFAFAISTKVYPLAILPFFVLKRKWRLLASSFALMFLMNVMSIGLIFGLEQTKSLYHGFWTRSVLGQSGLQLAVIQSDKMSYTNQSSALLARRYTRPTDSGVDGPDGRPLYINLTNWEDVPIRIGPVSLVRVQHMLLLYYLAILGPTVWICRHPARVCSWARMRYEYAAFILLALLLSPIVWSFYYVLCYFPLVLVNWRGLLQLKHGKYLSATLLVAVLWWLALVAIAFPIVRMCGYHWAACLALFILMLSFAACSRLAQNEGRTDTNNRFSGTRAS